MVSWKLTKCIFLGSLPVCGYFAGTHLERRKLLDHSKDTQLRNLPALPLFGTVSAASPIAPAQSTQLETNVSRVSQIMKYGFPSLDHVRSFDDYVLSYDRRNRVAHWVFEHLTADRVKPNDGVDRSKCEFKPDESIHKFFRFVCVFFMTFHVFRKESDGKNYVKYEVIGANHVAVPTHFYKVVVGETADGNLEMEAYVMPNQVIDNETPLTSFQVPPESIERAAGLLFFDNISRSKISKINGKKS
nr:endonuclease G, mitochondrial-like [Leptinotarsa decemlineata]